MIDSAAAWGPGDSGIKPVKDAGRSQYREYWRARGRRSGADHPDSSGTRGRGINHLAPAAIDELDPVVVRVADEAEQRPALAHPVGLALGLDALVLQPREGFREVVHADGDVAVGGPHLVGPAVGVMGQLELLVLAGEGEEVVRGLELAVADDGQLATGLHAERL